MSFLQDERTLYDEEHDLLRHSFRRWLDDAVVGNYSDWERAGSVPREIWSDAASHGFLSINVPEDCGGEGSDDFRFNAVIDEEIYSAGVPGLALGIQNDVCLPYIEQYAQSEKRREWIEGMAAGERIAAIAMTEPGTGSDLAGISTTARRDGDCYVLNGQKTFITNGILNDLVIVVANTNPDAPSPHQGISLLVVERGMPGYERGRNLSKIGLKAQDTAELFFEDVRVPAANVLGEPGAGFSYLMGGLPQERLSIAVCAVAHAASVLEQTFEYVRSRKVFGEAVGSFQNTRFRLAEFATEVRVARAFLDECLSRHLDGRLSAVGASMAKLHATEMQQRVIDGCLQLHGGYGYMTEYFVGRAFVDARVQTIYGGTNEIMREIIGRSLNLQAFDTRTGVSNG